MDGFTNKYLNEEYPDWSVNYTRYVDSNGNEMIISISNSDEEEKIFAIVDTMVSKVR